MEEQLKNDLRYYKRKLKRAIELLQAAKIDEWIIRAELDMEVKEWEHIMDEIK